MVDKSASEAGDRKHFVRSRKRFKVYTWKYKKTITPIASFILLVNQIFGFGMNVIPSVIREGGWFRVLVANFGVCVVACVCSLMLLKSMTFIPHNSNFQQRIEYNTLVKYYLSDFYFKLVSLLHYIGDFCTIICGIITFSKLVDIIMVKLVGFTFALQLYPHLKLGRVGSEVFTFIYERTDAEHRLGVFGVTLGYLVCTLVCTRLSSSSLEETTRFHVTSFLILLGCCVQLCVYSFYQIFVKTGGRFFQLASVFSLLSLERHKSLLGELRNRLLLGRSSAKSLSRSGSRMNFLDILLTFVDNYSVASTLPSWANEMTNQVNPTSTLWLSSLFAFVTYILVGLLFSKTFSTSGSASILDDIFNSSYNVFVNFSISLFVIVTSIPDVVFGCISTRYNLLNLGYLNSSNSYFWGCLFPFMFTWLLLNDSLFQNLLGNLGMISALICDFFVPVLLYIVAYSRDYSNFTHVKRPSLYKRTSKLLFTRISRMSQHDFFKKFHSFFKRGPSEPSLQDVGSAELKSDSEDGRVKKTFSMLDVKKSISSNFSTFTAFLTKDSSFSNRFLNSKKYTKSISLTSIGNNIGRKLSSTFSNRFTRSISLTIGNRFSFTTSISSSISNCLSKTFTKSISNNFRKSFTTSFRKSISLSFRKSISSNFSSNLSRSFTKNLANLNNTEGITLDPNSPSDSYLDKKAVSHILNNLDFTKSNMGSKVEFKVSEGEGQEQEGVGKTESIGKDVQVDKEKGVQAAGPGEEVKQDPEVDYKSFRIIRNSKEMNRTHDEFFNAVNRPSKAPPFIQKPSVDESKDDSKGQGRDGAEHKRERVWVFPKLLFKHHLLIAKGMIVSISLLTIVTPGVQLFNLFK